MGRTNCTLSTVQFAPGEGANWTVRFTNDTARLAETKTVHARAATWCGTAGTLPGACQHFC